MSFSLLRHLRENADVVEPTSQPSNDVGLIGKASNALNNFGQSVDQSIQSGGRFIGDKVSNLGKLMSDNPYATIGAASLPPAIAAGALAYYLRKKYKERAAGGGSLY